MKNNNSKKGFTLIEMLVVVAVISILSGLTLTGIAGFTSRARDTRRIGDMKITQNYIEAYFSKCGYYPGGLSGTNDCANTTPSGIGYGTGQTPTAGTFRAVLNGVVGVSAPNDPVATKTYFYGVETTNYLRYVLGTNLENQNSSLSESGEIGDTTTPTPAGTWVFTNGTYANCTDPVGTPPLGYGYCIGN